MGRERERDIAERVFMESWRCSDEWTRVKEVVGCDAGDGFGWGESRVESRE